MGTIEVLSYLYEVDGRVFEIVRRHVGTAYARNGNVHNPTNYFKWELRDGGEFKGIFNLRSEAYEYATGHAYCAPDGTVMNRSGLPVRNFMLVRDEMQKNYRGRRGHGFEDTQK